MPVTILFPMEILSEKQRMDNFSHNAENETLCKTGWGDISFQFVQQLRVVTSQTKLYINMDVTWLQPAFCL